MLAYKITNLATGGAYIGITRRKARERFRDHLWRALVRKDDTFLARAIRNARRLAERSYTMAARRARKEESCAQQ